MSIRLHLACLALLADLLLSGCNTTSYSRAYFANATINNHPAHVVMDTDSNLPCLDPAGAERLNIHFPNYTRKIDINGSHEYTTLVLAPVVPITLGHQSFSAALPVAISTLNGANSGFENSPDPLSTDAYIGWPEVRQNILVFDGDTRTISAAPEIPVRAYLWLRFPLSPESSDRLVIQVPLPEGGDGNIILDTGQPWGVSIPRAQWDAWIAAHPQAPTTFHLGGLANGNASSFPEAWADQITLGSLTLTDVPIHPASSVEDFHTKSYLGTLGLYALTRTDLVVDGPHLVAFLNPKSPPGPAYPGFNRPNVAPSPAGDFIHPGDWSVADSVTLALDYIYAKSGQLQYLLGDYPAANLSLNQALALNPRNLTALFVRGQIKIALGDSSAALDDFNRILLYFPSEPAVFFQSAIAAQILGDNPQAIADYGLVLQHPSGDAPAALLNRHVLILQQTPGPDPSLAIAASWPSGWDKSLGQFLLGQINESALLDAADTGEDEAVAAQRCAAYYFIGMTRSLRGDSPGAKSAWQKCVAPPLPTFNEYQAFARVQLALLAQKPLGN